METPSVVGIVGILTYYLVGQIRKIVPDEHLPLISGLLGLTGVFLGRFGALGSDADLLTSLIFGLAAGLAPVGAHQIGKQRAKAKAKQGGSDA